MPVTKNELAAFDPNLFIDALEGLDEWYYTCHALARADEARTGAKYSSSYDSPAVVAYARLFCVNEGEFNGAWLCVHAQVLEDWTPAELRAWRETALCFAALIAADGE